MPQLDFSVKARSRQGKLIDQKVKAASESEAIARIRELGLTPLAVEECNRGLSKEIHFGKGRVRLKDLAIFSRQFATMLGSGVSVLRCLDILSEQTESRRLAELLDQMRTEIEKGSSLSETMRRRKEFPPLMTSMVQAGEVGGFLDSTMVEIAVALEAEVRLRGKIKSALSYPMAVAVLAVLIVIGMLIFIVPVFSGLFADLGGRLPLPTQILVSASNALKNPFIMIPTVTLIAALAGLYVNQRHRPAVRQVIDPLKLKLPVFGPLLQKIALARFTRNLSSLLRAGVPILTALDIVGDTSGNVVVASAVDAVKESVRNGSGVARPLAEHSVFPDMVVQMITVGEDTGELDTMLAKVADFFDQEVEATTEQLMALLEPIMIVVLGAVVGGILISLYLPMFKIFELIQ